MKFEEVVDYLENYVGVTTICEWQANESEGYCSIQLFEPYPDDTEELILYSEIDNFINQIVNSSCYLPHVDMYELADGGWVEIIE